MNSDEALTNQLLTRIQESLRKREDFLGPHLTLGRRNYITELLETLRRRDDHVRKPVLSDQALNTPQNRTKALMLVRYLTFCLTQYYPSVNVSPPITLPTDTTVDLLEMYESSVDEILQIQCQAQNIEAEELLRINALEVAMIRQIHG